MTELARSLREVVAQIRGDGVASLRSEQGDGSTARQIHADVSRNIYEKYHARWQPTATFDVVTRNHRFESELSAAVPHLTSLVDAEVVEEAGGAPLVALEGVFVRIQSANLISGERDTPFARIPAVRPTLSPGFLLVDGSKGRPSSSGIGRFYVHLDSPSRGLEIWRVVVTCLENLGVRYRVKVASRHEMFPRTDAMVIYCSAADTPEVRAALRLVLMRQGHRGSRGSAFAEHIQSGLAYAEEPTKLPDSALSFGQHRSRALARGVLRASDVGWVGAESLVVAELRKSGIDPSRPWRDLRVR